MSRSAPVVLLFLALLNSVLGFSILFPIFGPLGRQLGLGEVQIGWLSAAYSLMQFIASPWWGKRSERIGRRPVLLTGIWGFCFGFTCFGLVAWLGMRGTLTGHALFATLLASRVITGALSSAVMPSAQAYVADITPRERRASGMAIVGAAFGVGVVLGPGLGAALASFGLLVPVYCSAAVALLNGLFVMAMLPEPERHERSASDAAGERAYARIWPLLAVAFGLTLATVALEQTIAFLYQDVLRLSHENAARTVGIALVLYGLGAVAAQMTLMRTRLLSPHLWLLIGVVLTAVGLMSTALADQFSTLTASLVLQGFASGLAMPSLAAVLSLGAGDHRQGEVAGLNSSAQAMGRALGPIAGTALYTLNCRSPFWVGASLSALLGLVLLVRHAQRPHAA